MAPKEAGAIKEAASTTAEGGRVVGGATEVSGGQSESVRVRVRETLE